MRVWIDIENPPQVQYLAPFERALTRRGHEAFVTGRDVSITLSLLHQRGIHPLVVGSSAGGSKPRKVLAIGSRAARLGLRLAGPRARPDLGISASRSAALASAVLRIPSFTFCDYEYVDLRFARLTGAHVVHPDVIDVSAFLSQGIPRDRLIPFPNLKEAISFADIDLEAVEPHHFSTPRRPELMRVLLRPAGEQAHYFVSESKRLAFELLEFLSRRSDVELVYLPRYPHQVSYLDGFKWANTPVLVREAIPFVALLRAVDAVVASGGTMLREAAYLGLPAYSILRSAIGSVDRHLESLGRLTILESRNDFDQVLGRTRHPPMPPAPTLVSDLIDQMLERAHRA